MPQNDASDLQSATFKPFPAGASGERLEPGRRDPALRHRASAALALALTLVACGDDADVVDPDAGATGRDAMLDIMGNDIGPNVFDGGGEADAGEVETEPGVNTALITDIEVIELTSTSARISWTLVEGATGSITYGPTSEYGSETTEEASFTYETHRQSLVGLEPGTTYHFRVRGRIESGEMYLSDNQTLVTPDVVEPPVGEGDVRLGVTSMMSLSDTSIRNWVSVRFVAEHTGFAESVRQYIVTKRPGDPDRWYARGNGGILQIQICPDVDGLPALDACFPGEVVIDFRPHFVDGLYRGPDRRGYIDNVLLGLHEFDEPIALTKGTTYHILYKNLDSNPTANYVGYDAVGIAPPLPLPSRGSPVPNLGRPTNLELLLAPGVSRSPRADGFFDLPIYELRFADGNAQGQGIMQWEPDLAFTLAGSGAIRYTVNVPTDTTVSTLGVALAHHASGSVALSIETLDGNVLRSVSARTNGPRSHRSEVWAAGDVEPFTLQAGEDYAFVIRAENGYRGRVIANQCGVRYGFDRRSCFGYGVAQNSTNGRDWRDWHSSNSYFFGMVMQ